LNHKRAPDPNPIASSSAAIENFEKLVGGPRDGALLRYALGSEWLKAGEPHKAAACLREAVAFDANYSAAWKQLGKALAASGDDQAAIAAYENGIRVADARGDKQAAKEMAVFAKRLAKKVL